MKRLLSIVLLFALAVTTLAALPVQAAEAPITSTEEDSIVPSPWDNAELDNSAQFLPSDSGDADAADTYHAEDASQEAPLASLPFQDVQPGSWYYDDVVAAYEAGLMEGVSSTKFAPYSTLTRAQVVTVLYRMEGSPSVSGSSGFSACFLPLSQNPPRSSQFVLISAFPFPAGFCFLFQHTTSFARNLPFFSLWRSTEVK